jgi:hypothetical protein
MQEVSGSIPLTSTTTKAGAVQVGEVIRKILLNGAKV